MKNYRGSSILALVTGLMLVAGCAPRTAQQPGGDGTVAGTREQYPQGQQPATTTTTAPNRVTVTLTDTAIEVSPSRIPTGNLTVLVRNNSSSPQSLQIAGGKTKQTTGTLRPGESKTIKLTSVKPGTYQVTMPSPPRGRTRSTSRGAFTVTQHAQTTQPGAAFKTGTSQPSGTMTPTATPGSGK